MLKALPGLWQSSWWEGYWSGFPGHSLGLEEDHNLLSSLHLLSTQTDPTRMKKLSSEGRGGPQTQRPLCHLFLTSLTPSYLTLSYRFNVGYLLCGKEFVDLPRMRASLLSEIAPFRELKRHFLRAILETHIETLSWACQERNLKSPVKQTKDSCYGTTDIARNYLQSQAHHNVPGLGEMGKGRADGKSLKFQISQPLIFRGEILTIAHFISLAWEHRYDFVLFMPQGKSLTACPLDPKVCRVAVLHFPTVPNPQHRHLWFGSGCCLGPRATEVCWGWTLRSIFPKCLYTFPMRLGFLPPWRSQFSQNSIKGAEVHFNFMQKTALLQTTAFFFLC